LLEAREADVEVVPVLFDDRQTAAPQLLPRLAKGRLERILCHEPLFVDERERAEQIAARHLRRCRRGDAKTSDCEHHREHDRLHRVSPSPSRELRASIMPKPKVLSRPFAPRSTANFSSAASTAAGSVMPCCINIAATPDTCGAAIEVPV